MTRLGSHDESLSLHSQIQRHAVRAPFDPWIFFRRGLDWRWISWREAESAVESLRGALGAVEARGALGLPRILDPRLVLAWAASEASGRECILLGAHYHPSELLREAEGKGCVAWWQLAPAQARERGLGELPECLVLPLPAHEEGGQEAVEEEPSLVEGERREKQRDVAFLASGLPLGTERAFIRWTVDVGAALLLEPEDDSVAAMVHWSRPTVTALMPRHLASLATGLWPGSDRELRRLRRHHRNWRWALVADLHGESVVGKGRRAGLELLRQLGVQVLP